MLPMAYAEKALKLYKDAKLVTVPGADHCFNGHLDELAAAIRGFFEK